MLYAFPSEFLKWGLGHDTRIATSELASYPGPFFFAKKKGLCTRLHLSARARAGGRGQCSTLITAASARKIETRSGSRTCTLFEGYLSIVCALVKRRAKAIGPWEAQKLRRTRTSDASPVSCLTVCPRLQY